MNNRTRDTRNRRRHPVAPGHIDRSSPLSDDRISSGNLRVALSQFLPRLSGRVNSQHVRLSPIPFAFRASCNSLHQTPLKTPSSLSVLLPSISVNDLSKRPSRSRFRLLVRISKRRQRHDPYILGHAQRNLSLLLIEPADPARPQTQVSGRQHQMLHCNPNVQQVVRLVPLHPTLLGVGARHHNRRCLFDPFVTRFGQPSFCLWVADHHERPALTVRPRRGQPRGVEHLSDFRLRNRIGTILANASSSPYDLCEFHLQSPLS